MSIIRDRQVTKNRGDIVVKANNVFLVDIATTTTTMWYRSGYRKKLTMKTWLHKFNSCDTLREWKWYQLLYRQLV